MNKLYIFALSIVVTNSVLAGSAGPSHASGKIIQVSGSSNPHIRLDDSTTPTGCDGGSYGWMDFKGETPEDKHRIYATALTAAIAGKSVTVYTNSDNTGCEIRTIEVSVN